MTIQEFRTANRLSYSGLSKLLGISKSRAYNICHNRGGDLKRREINSLIKASGGRITPRDLGVCQEAM